LNTVVDCGKWRCVCKCCANVLASVLRQLIISWIGAPILWTLTSRWIMGGEALRLTNFHLVSCVVEVLHELMAFLVSFWKVGVGLHWSGEKTDAVKKGCDFGIVLLIYYILIYCSCLFMSSYVSSVRLLLWIYIYIYMFM
jgi:hypothetical protein